MRGHVRGKLRETDHYGDAIAPGLQYAQRLKCMLLNAGPEGLGMSAAQANRGSPQGRDLRLSSSAPWSGDKPRIR